MYCKNCGSEMPSKGVQCFQCGHKKKQPLKTAFIILFFLFCCTTAAVSAYLWGDFNEPSQNNRLASESLKTPLATAKQDKVTQQPVISGKPLTKAQQKSLTKIISDVQETVYTIYTDASQGSGFLYNANGDVVTNAHVVEGASTLSVKTKDGKSYDGQVIGYSNEIDVAVIHVPALAGISPSPIEKESPLQIGEEVIALGSPLGMENTATMGYITGKDRNFTIGQFTYNNLYQTSAEIAPGSSGGPLVSKKTEKIVAINSAQSMSNQSMGFSIPVYKVSGIIQSWIDQPMSEDAIYDLFYGDDGSLFYDSLWDLEDGYFDEGDYSEDENDYDYWEYEDEEDDNYDANEESGEENYDQEDSYNDDEINSDDYTDEEQTDEYDDLEDELKEDDSENWDDVVEDDMSVEDEIDY